MSSPDKLPRFIHDILASVPKHGDGIHRWLYGTARYLHHFRSHSEIAELLRASLHDCGRDVPNREIEAAINDSKAAAWVPGEKKQDVYYKPQWPEFNAKKYNLLVNNGHSAYDLWENSPIRYIDDRPYSEEIVDELFPGNPFLCCGLSSTVFETKHRREWRGQLSKQQFIVPSPCVAEMGMTKEGKASAHCIDNTGDRHYLVIEQDKGDQDQQAAVIVHLTKYLRLVMVVFSGGKSLHAWFHCKGKDEVELKKIMVEAVSLGADPPTWVKSQFVRMPDGQRADGKLQGVLYFDPVTQ